MDSPGIDDLAAGLRASFCTAVGFGILGIQQVQVFRRDVQHDLARRAVEMDGRIDPVLDDMEARLPGELRAVLRSARAAGRTVRDALLDQRSG